MALGAQSAMSVVYGGNRLAPTPEQEQEQARDQFAEELQRDLELVEGRGVRSTLPDDPVNARELLLNQRPFTFQTPVSPLEQIGDTCRDVVFEGVKPASYVGDAFRASSRPLNVTLADNSESFLWLPTQANGDFSYVCNGEQRAGNIQPHTATPFRPDRSCFGRLCRLRSAEHPWGNKDLLAQVTLSPTQTGPNLRIRGIMACDAGTAPRGTGDGIPNTCAFVPGFDDVY